MYIPSHILILIGTFDVKCYRLMLAIPEFVMWTKKYGLENIKKIFVCKNNAHLLFTKMYGISNKYFGLWHDLIIETYGPARYGYKNKKKGAVVIDIGTKKIIIIENFKKIYYEWNNKNVYSSINKEYYIDEITKTIIQHNKYVHTEIIDEVGDWLPFYNK